MRCRFPIVDADQYQSTIDALNEWAHACVWKPTTKVPPRGRIEAACGYLRIRLDRLERDELGIHFSRKAYGCGVRRESRRNAGTCWRQYPPRYGEVVTGKRPLVSVVDDDESVRESLPDLLRELGYEAQVFSSAQEFLKSEYVAKIKCLILDIAMPGMSGPELQDELTRRQVKIPVIFITAQKDEAVRSRMLARGAVECLFKPFSDTALQKALNTALQIN